MKIYTRKNKIYIKDWNYIENKPVTLEYDYMERSTFENILKETWKKESTREFKFNKYWPSIERVNNKYKNKNKDKEQLKWF